MPQKHEKSVRRKWPRPASLKKSWRGFGGTLRQFAQRYSKTGSPDEPAVLTSSNPVPISSMTTKQGTSAKKTAKKSVKKVSKQTTKAPAKKTAKKAVAKKTTPKKSSPKKVAKKTGAKTTKSSGKKLVTAKGANCFWVHEGPILKDLRELEAALEAMSEAMFTHHVSKERNDFADWVEHTLKDAAAAADMRKAKKPHTARKVVVRHLKLYRLPN